MIWDVLELAAGIDIAMSIIRRFLLPVLLIVGVLIGGACLAANALSWAFPPPAPSSKATKPVIRQSQSKPKYDDGNPANSYVTQPTDE